jgi:two-component system cell cycle sensor histidine kinase/response regulator CckA
MSDDKIKTQPIRPENPKSSEQIGQNVSTELSALRQRVAELETMLTKRRQAHEKLIEQYHLLQKTLNTRTTELNWANDSLRQEIAVRKQVEESTQSHLKFLETLLDTIPHPVFYKDRAGVFQGCNKTFSEQILGLPREKILGRSLFDLPEVIPADLADIYHARDKELLELTGILRYEVPVQCADGDRRQFLFSTATFSDATDRVVGIVGVMVDITEQKQTEEVFRRYERIVSTIPDLVFLIDREYVYQVINDACLAAHGKSRDEIIGHTVAELFGNDVFENQIRGYLDRCLVGETVHYQAWFNFAVWGRRFMRLTYCPYFGADDTILGAAISSHDITDLKQMEEALRTGEERYRTLFEQANDAIHLATIDDRIIDINHRACEMMGYSREELLSMRVSDLQAPEVRRKQGEVVRSELARYGNSSFEGINIHRDGTRIPVEINVSQIKGLEGDLFISVVRDITERKRAEEALRESERKIRGIIEQSIDGIMLANEEGLIIEWNRGQEQLTGQTRSEVMGRPLWDVMFEVVIPERKNLEIYEQFKNVLDTFFETGHWSHLNQISEIEMLRLDGVRRIIQLVIFPIKTDKGFMLGSISRDVTQHRQAEDELRESKDRLEEALARLKTTQQQVVQQERLAAVGQLAAGIAHDFNNLLTTIIGFAELLRVDPAIPEAAQADLARISKQGQRGAHLVRQILDFARQSIRQPQLMDLVPFVKEVARFLERTIREHIRLSLKVEVAELPVKADPAQLQQMLANLALNAQDALPGGGELKLCLSRYSLEPGQPPAYVDLPPGEWAVISVSDSGPGIAEDLLPRIFEPFFTTKQPGEGSGLGLAQVYGIVKQHEGYIDVTSQPGAGTTFTVYLPLAVINSAAQEVTSPEIHRPTSELILLVEDQPDVLVVSQAMLQRLGYRVLAAGDGQQALELYDHHAAEIALVLTDMLMPQMDGMVLFKELKSRNPAIKVVLMTGYPLKSEEAQQFFSQGIVDWLQKPMLLNQLAHVISQAVHGASDE